MPSDSIKNHIVHQGGNDIFWKLKHIVSHEGLHIAPHPNEKGSWYNFMVEWGTGDNTTETLTIIIGGDTTTCDLYADNSQ